MKQIDTLVFIDKSELNFITAGDARMKVISHE